MSESKPQQKIKQLKSQIKELESKVKHLETELEKAKKEVSDEFTRIRKVTTAINSSLKEDEVLEMIITELRNLFNVEGVVIMLVDKERKYYEFYKVSFPEYLKEIEQRLFNVKFPLNIKMGGAIAVSILNKDFIYFPEVDYNDIENPANRQAAIAMQIKSNVIHPIIVQDQAIGAIFMSTHTKKLDLTEDDINRMEYFIEQIGTAIHNALLYDELEQERNSLEEKVKERTKDLRDTINELEKTKEELTKRNVIIEKDLSYARKIQLGIIPAHPPKFSGFEIYTSYNPLDKLGGDLYDFIEISEDLLGTLICDVSGHGVPAAFITSMIKLGMSYNRVIQKNPGVFLDYLRETLNYHMHGMYFSGAYCVINKRFGEMSYANAGHLPILLIRQGQITELVADGSVIGFNRNYEFKVEKVTLEKGDRIILYTDGLIEASQKHTRDYEKIYGKKRFYDFIKKNHSFGQEKLVEALYNDIFSYTEETHFNDDVAIIIIDKTE